MLDDCTRALATVAMATTFIASAVLVLAPLHFAQTAAGVTLLIILYSTILQYENRTAVGPTYYSAFGVKNPLGPGASPVLKAIVMGPFFAWWAALPAGFVLATACHVGNPETTLNSAVVLTAVFILLLSIRFWFLPHTNVQSVDSANHYNGALYDLLFWFALSGTVAVLVFRSRFWTMVTVV